MGQRNEGYELRPLSSQQKWLTAQFKRSLREVVPTTMVSQLDLGHLRAASKRLMSQSAGHGPVRYVSDFQFFAYWVVRVIADFPLLRCTLESESQLRQYEHVNLGIAVQTEGGDLMTACEPEPVHLDSLIQSLGELSQFPNTELRDWTPERGPRLAAISSFGFGATNCHMIVEEAV